MCDPFFGEISGTKVSQEHTHCTPKQTHRASAVGVAARGRSGNIENRTVMFVSPAPLPLYCCRLASVVTNLLRTVLSSLTFHVSRSSANSSLKKKRASAVFFSVSFLSQFHVSLNFTLLSGNAGLFAADLPFSRLRTPGSRAFQSSNFLWHLFRKFDPRRLRSSMCL